MSVRSENRTPVPSMSSGATAEYDRSRQSTDSIVRPRVGRAFRLCTARGGGPLPAPRSRPPANRWPRARSHDRDRLGAAPDPPQGRPPKRLHHPGTAGRGRDTDPKVVSDRPEQTRPTEAGDASLPSPLATEMASHRRHPRESAVSCLSQTTRRFMPVVVFTAASLRPGSPKKASRRIAATSDVTPT